MGGKLRHFKRNIPLRIFCDASKHRLGAVLQQCEENQWTPISCASRFLTKLETKYSINELELLAVVWSVENFKKLCIRSTFWCGIGPQGITKRFKIQQRKQNRFK